MKCEIAADDPKATFYRKIWDRKIRKEIARKE